MYILSVRANSVDQGQTPQNAVSDQALYLLPITQQCFSDTSMGYLAFIGHSEKCFFQWKKMWVNVSEKQNCWNIVKQCRSWSDAAFSGLIRVCTVCSNLHFWILRLPCLLWRQFESWTLCQKYEIQLSSTEYEMSWEQNSELMSEWLHVVCNYTVSVFSFKS